MQKPDNPFSVTIEEIYHAFSTNENGLSGAAAKQGLDVYGENVLAESHKKTILSILLDQFKNLMIIVLLAAAIISAFLGEVSDAVIIFVVVLLNAVMGTVQESKAEAALEALKKMAAPSVNVIRDGKMLTVKAAMLVPGDVVVLAAGDHVPADMRLVSSASLKIDEAALTGESVPVEKNADAVCAESTPLAERVNMAYSGTSVTYGRGLGVVCYTGMRTEIGKIADALKAAKEGETPLQKRMNGLSKVLSIAVLAIAAVIFVIGVLTGRLIEDMFLVAVSLAVAAIPEGLATVVTLQMTMGVQRMSRRGAIIRKLPAVETLGSTNVICSDKTGTLTQNKMRVLKAFYSGTGKSDDALEPSEELLWLDRVFMLCNDTRIIREDGRDKLVGDPTETALFAFAAARLDYESANNGLPRLFEIPFDSERKLMSTVNGLNQAFLFVKGAPDALIERCTNISVGGEIFPLTEETKKEIYAANERFANEALRVLAAAYKPLETVPESADGLENELVFLGLAGMMDPPRPEVKEAVRICKSAGIRPCDDHRRPYRHGRCHCERS